MMKSAKILVITSCVATLAACTHPPLAVSPGASTASVEFSNQSFATAQHYFFDDPVACKQPYVITAISGSERKSVAIPAGKTITIWTSAWGLPASSGTVSYCRPSAFSTTLVAGKSYRAEFIVDQVSKKCGVRLSSAEGLDVIQIGREISGPEIAGGPLTQAMTCNPKDDLSRLSR